MNPLKKVIKYILLAVLVGLIFLELMEYFRPEESWDPIAGTVGKELDRPQVEGGVEEHPSPTALYIYKGVEFIYPEDYRVEVVDNVGLMFDIFSSANREFFVTRIIIAPRNESGLSTQEWIREHYKSGWFEFEPINLTERTYFYDMEQGLAIDVEGGQVITMFNGKNERRLNEKVFLEILGSLKISERDL